MPQLELPHTDRRCALPLHQQGQLHACGGRRQQLQGRAGKQQASVLLSEGQPPGQLLYHYERASEYSFQAQLPLKRCEDGAHPVHARSVLASCCSAIRWGQSEADGDLF